MQPSFFFYDLETTGFDPKSARIMQFAGQRTDMDLNPIGEPINVLIKLTPDVLPSPDAILVTGITPQQTLMEGLTEAEFLKYFHEEVVKPSTIFVGFNTVRFDDEFMRYTLYRNFYDPYAWQWRDNCSRWDVLDLVRMTRALRPDDIKWPFTPDGKPTNRLELLTAENGLDHSNAHDALNDVFATIAVARLIKERQPELFAYLLKIRNKQAAKDLITKGDPFVYSTGRYSAEFLNTSAAVMLGKHPEQDAALVYDLRHDPRPFMKMSVPELVEAWRFSKDPDTLRLPVKTIKYNRCPSVAPLGVMKDEATQARLNLTIDQVKENLSFIKQGQADFLRNLHEAVKQLDQERQSALGKTTNDNLSVDARLYDGFVGTQDSTTMAVVRALPPDELSDYKDKFSDDRLKLLLPLYKARNYPKDLSSDERAEWEDFLKKRLFTGGQASAAAKYFARLQELSQTVTDKSKQYLLEELKLYGESILPDDVSG